MNPCSNDLALLFIGFAAGMLVSLFAFVLSALRERKDKNV
jgi:hypothetical protein